jgi:hypothetical protein
MVQETPINAGDQQENAPEADSVDTLISALQELRTNISRVEEQHPLLRNDLSSLCDLVIEHLNRPEKDIRALFKTKLQDNGSEVNTKIIRELEAVIQNLPLESNNNTIPLQKNDNVNYNEDTVHITDMVSDMPRDSIEPSKPPDIKRDTPINAFSTAVPNNKPLTNAFDKAGDGLLASLDKMGDGIIFIFEKLLSLGSKKK